MMFLLGAAALLLAACNSNDEGFEDTDVFIFGTYFGHCFGNCSHIYKLEHKKLYSDEVDYLFPNDELQFSSEPIMEQSKIDLAIEIQQAFPAILLMSTDTVWGCPDCADQGGYYFEWKSELINRRWFVDTNSEELDAEVHQYLLDLNEKLQRIID